MLTLANIIAAIQISHVRITNHADEEAQADNLTFDEIYFSVLHGEIIETYFADKPYPSCLIYGHYWFHILWSSAHLGLGFGLFLSFVYYY